MTTTNNRNDSWKAGDKQPPTLDEVRELFNAGMATKDKRVLLEEMRAVALDHALGAAGQKYDRLLKLIDDALNAL